MNFLLWMFRGGVGVEGGGGGGGGGGGYAAKTLHKSMD